MFRNQENQCYKKMQYNKSTDKIQIKRVQNGMIRVKGIMRKNKQRGRQKGRKNSRKR